MAKRATFYDLEPNFPEYINVNIENHHYSHVVGTYYRQWDAVLKKMYYVKCSENDIEEYYLFRGNDLMWTISEKYESSYFVVYYPRETENVLSCSSAWMGHAKYCPNRDVKVNISKMGFNKPVSKVRNVTASTQTNINKINTKNKKKKDKTQKKQIKEVSECPTCSICFEEVGVLQNICKLPCKHVFHSGCILPWILEHRDCPNCRKKY